MRQFEILKVLGVLLFDGINLLEDKFLVWNNCVEIKGCWIYFLVWCFYIYLKIKD